MAEAEDVITDVARHATIYVRDLWRRHRPEPDIPPTVTLVDIAARLDLFICAVFGSSYPLRSSQLPSRATLLAILFKCHRRPRRQVQIPATDGVSLWLPPDSGIQEAERGTQLYRVMAIQQAIRARRGSATVPHPQLSPLLADVYLLLEAYAADRELVTLLPGLANSVDLLRRKALALRPPLSHYPAARRPLEQLAQRLMAGSCSQPLDDIPVADCPAQSLDYAHDLIRDLKLVPDGTRERKLGPQPLLKDWWTGELRPPPVAGETLAEAAEGSNTDGQDGEKSRSAQLRRRPEERKAREGEDDDEESPGIWMIQMDEPHQHAEDPLGLQRPTDRDNETGAEEFGDLVSELSEARLIATPGRPREVLLSDDPPDARAHQELKAAIAEGKGISYPEWDYRASCYREPGATVRLLSAQQGSQHWVDHTLAAHRTLLNAIRKRFEMLRACRVRQRRQVDGDDIDLDAYIDSYADFRAGHPMAEGLYQSRRTAERNLAITLLIDISGSTDSWVSPNRRIIDVEREALLLVCTALESLAEPYSVIAFSGEGPNAVTLCQIKAFSEHYSNEVALRISALEPQHYTRAGAAIRHATIGLMQQPAAHRLLLLLSDGKPNDKDDYEGRYGVEDMRQAVIEAKLQGVFPFCLTIDRQAAAYLPRIFGANQYALLPKPEFLSEVLLDWIKRLLTP